MATNIKVRIINDRDAESPRSWDNLGTMVCAHRRYKLGDEDGMQKAVELIRKHLSDKQLDDMCFDETHAPSVEEALEATGQVIMLPLYLYDHSGITMRCKPFSCPFDSGKVGFIFVSKAQARNENNWKLLTSKRINQIETTLEGEVEVYDQYLTGDTWGFEVIEDDDVIDSCWGFFGSDPLTNGILDHLSDPAKQLVRSGNYERPYA